MDYSFKKVVFCSIPSDYSKISYINKISKAEIILLFLLALLHDNFSYIDYVLSNERMIVNCLYMK
jgi:hypothetical protein